MLVAGIKAADYMGNYNIRAALVSTNSITQEKVFRFSGNRFLNQVYILILHTEHLYGIVKRQ